jgi:hypothetical protein
MAPLNITAAGMAVQNPSENEQQIGQAVQVLQRMRPTAS